MLSATGQITTSEGWAVLSFAEMRIPKNFTNLSVNHDGKVNATHGGKTEMIGQIKLYSSDNAFYDNYAHGMINIGDHLYTVWEETDHNPSIQKHPSPMTPHHGTVLQGWLEDLGPSRRPTPGSEWAVED